MCGHMIRSPSMGCDQSHALKRSGKGPSLTILPSQCLECRCGLKTEIVILSREGNRATIERTLLFEDCEATLSFSGGFSSHPIYHHYTISCPALLKCSKGTLAYKLYTSQVDTHTILCSAKMKFRAYESPEDLVKIQNLFQSV